MAWKITLFPDGRVALELQVQPVRKPGHKPKHKRLPKPVVENALVEGLEGEAALVETEREDLSGFLGSDDNGQSMSVEKFAAMKGEQLEHDRLARMRNG